MIKLHHYGEGFPIVCLHGWGFDHTIWHCLFPLIHDWHLIMVDLPGHGQTKTMSMSTFTTELLKHLPQKFAVIGWSLGGLYAFHLSKQAGSRLKHLFAVSTSPCFMKQHGWPGINASVLTRFYRQYMRDPVLTVHEFIDLQFLKQPGRPQGVFMTKFLTANDRININHFSKK